MQVALALLGAHNVTAHMFENLLRDAFYFWIFPVMLNAFVMCPAVFRNTQQPDVTNVDPARVYTFTAFAIHQVVARDVVLEFFYVSVQ